MIFLIYGIYFSIGAFYSADSFGNELRQFCKTTAITLIFRFSSAIVHFVQPNLSGGTDVDANLVVMCAFYTDALKLSARNFGCEIKSLKMF